MENLAEAKRKLALANRILVNEGLTELGRGHVCYYLPGEKRILLPAHLHEFGRTIGTCSESDLVKIDMDGKVVEGNFPRSMGESYFYLEIFKTGNGYRAAAHAHPYYTNVLAMTGKKLLMMSRDSFLFVDGIPVFEELPLYIGNRDLARRLVDKMGRSTLVIHRGHGIFAAGNTIENVIVTIAALERAAKKQVLTYMAGGQKAYDEDEVRSKYSEELVEDLASTDWGYFVSRLERHE